LSLDQLFASETGITESKFDTWKQSHIPFHWFVEFPEALSSGGFDVVIGNPPYISRRKVTSYSFSGFRTNNLPDIYAPCVERSISLVSKTGAFSMIIPLSFSFSDDFSIAREVVSERFPFLMTSTFTQRPSALFDADVRPVVCTGLSLNNSALLGSDMRRWPQDFRPYLFETLQFSKLPVKNLSDPWPRIGNQRLEELFAALTATGSSVGADVVRSGSRLGYKAIARYFLSIFLDDPPSWTLQGRRTPQTVAVSLFFQDDAIRDIAFVLLSGRLNYWWWCSTGDDFNVTKGGLSSFPIAPNQLSVISKELVKLARRLNKKQWSSPLVSRNAGVLIGNFDMRECRAITDEADQLILAHLGLSKYWSAILLADAKLNKATQEASESRREWPFPL